MNSVPERDWKKLRAMQDKLLNVACKRILNKVSAIIETNKDNHHASYLELWKLLKKEDDEIAIMFDDVRRSNAIYKLTAWYRNNLLADDDLALFSEETQDIIHRLYQK